MSESPGAANPSYVLSLALQPDGWRVYLSQGSAPRIESISIGQAESIGRVFGDVVGGEIEPTPFMVVRNGTTTFKTALEAKLRQAEAAAAGIPGMRKLLQEIDG